MKAVIVMSAPRIGFLAHAWGALEAGGPLGIPVVRAHGVFWHHGLSEIMEEEIKKGTEYVITTDYDTIFNEHDLAELLRLMEATQHIDALCAMQVHRHKLGIMGDPLEAPSGPVTQMRQGHFGLTAIRTKSLDEVPRPWFTEKPCADGRWGEGSVHADIGFWRRWDKHGKTLFQANKVVLGHLQECILWPQKGGGTTFQHPDNWHKTRKPPKGVVGT